MANLLAEETSPYLLQHKDNPVAWRPWGPDALGHAAKEDKPIKVYREERPDVDDIYMEAVQGMTGQGGWPLTVFLDSDAVPYYGGTYFPPAPRHGLPSFKQVLEATSGAYETQREELREASARIRESLGRTSEVEQSDQPLDRSVMERAVAGLQANFDQANGGFGGAPKFPPPST